MKRAVSITNDWGFLEGEHLGHSMTATVAAAFLVMGLDFFVFADFLVLAH
jgi:hypothetical protein